MSQSSLDTYAISRHSKPYVNSKLASKPPSELKHICDRNFITIQCLHCGYRHQVATGSKDRTCPACAQTLYRDLYSKYEPIVLKSKNLKFLTLTYKPVKKQSPEIVRNLINYFKLLLHRKPYRYIWQGILAVVECKKTKDGSFYYHLHVLLDGGYVPQSQISQDWREISSFPICWIMAVHETPKRALHYTLKYILKGSSFLESKDRADFKESMFKTRLVHSYGSYYNYQYQTGQHVYYPCPVCGSIKCWIVLEFCNMELFENVSYE